MQPAIEIETPRASQSSIVLRCFGYLRPHWKLVTGVYTTMALIAVIAIINPQLLRWTIDHGIGTGDESALAVAVGGLLVLVLIKGVLTYYQGLWTEVASQ